MICWRHVAVAVHVFVFTLLLCAIVRNSHRLLQLPGTHERVFKAVCAHPAAFSGSQQSRPFRARLRSNSSPHVRSNSMCPVMILLFLRHTASFVTQCPQLPWPKVCLVTRVPFSPATYLPDPVRVDFCACSLCVFAFPSSPLALCAVPAVQVCDVGEH